MRVWKTPSQLAGKAEDLQLWLQIVTGMELDASGYVLHLSRAVWKERLRKWLKRDEQISP